MSRRLVTSLMTSRDYDSVNGTGDVRNPHTPLPRLPRRFCAGVQQSGTDSSPVSTRRPAATTLFHGQERDLATEPSLWPVQLYGTVYQQQFVKLVACVLLSASSKHICLLCALMTDYPFLHTFVIHSRSGAE